MKKLNNKIQVTSNADELYPDEFYNDEHYLTVIAGFTKHSGELLFKTAFSLYQFGLVLVQEAVFGKICHREFHVSLDYDDIPLVVDGVRLDGKSCVLHILFNSIDKNNFSDLPTNPDKFVLEEDWYIIFEKKLYQIIKNIEITSSKNKSYYDSYLMIEFPSRKAMYFFGKLLLWQSLYIKNFDFGWIKIIGTNTFFGAVLDNSGNSH